MMNDRFVAQKQPSDTVWPPYLSLLSKIERNHPASFAMAWRKLMIDCCHEHPVWREAFVHSLRSATVSERDCFALSSVWAINMVVGSYCFPRYVATLAARAEQDAVRHGLLENAWDESGGYNHTSCSHFWLAVRLARLLGLSDDEIERIQPLPEARAYTDEHYRQCASGDFGFAFGMICLIEEFTTPEFTMIFKAFLRSCKSGIGIDPESFVLNGGAEYFTANIADDERHREEMPCLVATWLFANGVNLDNPFEVTKGLEPVRAGARHSTKLRQEFFDGIYRFVNTGGTYRDLVPHLPG